MLLAAARVPQLVVGEVALAAGWRNRLAPSRGHPCPPGLGRFSLKVRRGFIQPTRRARIAHEVKQPAHDPEAITLAQAESRCLSGEAVREHVGVVVGSPYGVRHDLGDSFGILVIV